MANYVWIDDTGVIVYGEDDAPEVPSTVAPKAPDLATLKPPEVPFYGTDLMICVAVVVFGVIFFVGLMIFFCRNKCNVQNNCNCPVHCGSRQA